MTFHVPNEYRVRSGRLATTEANGNNGAFLVRLGVSARLQIIATDGEGWEHVSVSTPNRCPTWSEMCQVKEMFWDAEDCVIQYHPPASAYINNHRYCLHLWRPVGQQLPVPPDWMVGIKGLNYDQAKELALAAQQTNGHLKGAL